MSGAGSPTCRPESVHPRRPRGSQSGGRKGALVLETAFVGPFLPTRLTAPGSPRMGSVQLLKLVEKYEAAN